MINLSYYIWGQGQEEDCPSAMCRSKEGLYSTDAN